MASAVEKPAALANWVDGRCAILGGRRADEHLTRRINDKTARYCTHAVGVASGLWRCSQQRSRHGAELAQRISRRPPASSVHGIEEALSCPRTSPSASALACFAMLAVTEGVPACRLSPEK